MSAEPIRPLSLYDLTEELRAIEDALVSSGGVITDAMDERFEALREMHADKVEGYLAMIRKFEASADAIKAERERLQAAEKAMGNAAQTLKDRLADAMQRRGDEVYETKLGKVRLMTASKRSLVLDVDEADLPDDVVRVKRSADKSLIADMLKAGHPDAEQWAHFDEPSRYVRIY